MAKIRADYDYLAGHLRYGHVEMDLTAEDLEKFKGLSLYEQEAWLAEEGEIIVDDFEINDKGNLGPICISE